MKQLRKAVSERRKMTGKKMKKERKREIRQRKKRKRSKRVLNGGGKNL